MNNPSLSDLIKLIRYNILTSTTAAGTGHPTSSLSAVELLATLFFRGFIKMDLDNPKYIFNDRIIFSKGHASPLLYSLYQAAGVISHEELSTLRQFDSILEGHPTPRFKYIDVATGSLGQGLSIGLGMALGIKLKIKQENLSFSREPKVFVLLGDSEMAEGQVWEALQLASHYQTNNLIAILDVNRLGQRGETMLGWDVETYEKRISAFGWETVVVDGHNVEEIARAYETLLNVANSKPKMIIAKTVKGKGISFIEDQDNWHGKSLPETDLQKALAEIGPINKTLVGTVSKPEIVKVNTSTTTLELDVPEFDKNKLIATREAYGEALIGIAEKTKNIVVLDGETSNSTYAEKIKKTHPELFFEMYIAEQNMASTAVGFDKVQYKAFISTFAAFLTRAFDQIRMSQYSEAQVKVIGSHAGVSIGPDGSSQMALEDLAMMRSILKSIVLYPSDAVSTIKLVELMYNYEHVSYLRTTREKTPLLYSASDSFKIGGSKVVFESENDVAVVIGAGITLHEAIKAYHELQKEHISIAVVDAYSVKPLDEETIKRLAKKTNKVVVVEDHYPYGGLGEAVKNCLSGMDAQVCHLSVTKVPRSGTLAELLRFEEIDAQAIIQAVKSLLD